LKEGVQQPQSEYFKNSTIASNLLRATLDEGPRSDKIEQFYWTREIDWSLDEGLRPKTGKSRLNLHGTILEGKSIGLNQKNTELKRRAHDLKNQDAS
jgi:hypothetical protein